MGVLLKHLLSVTDTIWVYVSVVVVCVAGSYVVLKLEKLRAFRWLKYSH